ncbi:related to Kelch repeat-containing protein 1 [Zygosaccharomyces bailii]|nr:related to Kelch repeat-containing protein 1 [Zygosaccharomyces bailii]
MAPFKFAKKLTKDKKQSSSSVAGTPPRTSQSGHGPQAGPQGGTQGVSQSVQNGTQGKSNTAPSPGGPFGQNQFAHQNQFHVQNQTNNNKIPSPTPQQPQQVANSQFRVFPTPSPAQQRNASGASTSLGQQKEFTPWNRIKLQNSPFPRYRHVASANCSEDNRLYVIGGLHDQSVYGDTWVISSNESGTQFQSKTVDISETTPPPRVGHAATLCGNAFVLFGGDTHKVNSEGLMDDDLYLFNINSYKWTIPHPIGPRPLGRYGHKISIVAANQMKTKLYLFGGQFDDTYFNDLAVFDLSSFRRPDSHWEFLKPTTFVPPPLTNHTMISYEGQLWVFGGDTLQGLINQVFRYDVASNDWSILETTGSKPPPMQEHAAVLYKHLMVVVGGKDEHDAYLNSVYFLNLKTQEWFKLPVYKAGIPQGRSGHSLTLMKNDKLLIMGGDKFDYARPGEYDLNTSNTDMGKGTLLYTLDLSHLEDMCPGVLKVTDKNGVSYVPATPPVNPMQQQGKLAQPQQPNILTPYSQEGQHTPSGSSTPLQPKPLTPAAYGGVHATPENKDKNNQVTQNQSHINQPVQSIQTGFPKQTGQGTPPIQRAQAGQSGQTAQIGQSGPSGPSVSSSSLGPSGPSGPPGSSSSLGQLGHSGHPGQPGQQAPSSQQDQQNKPDQPAHAGYNEGDQLQYPSPNQYAPQRHSPHYTPQHQPQGQPQHPYHQRGHSRQMSDVKKPVSPIPELERSLSQEEDAPRVASLSSTETKDRPDSITGEVGVATLASSPLKGHVKLGSKSEVSEMGLSQSQTNGYGDSVDSGENGLSEPVQITKHEDVSNSTLQEQRSVSQSRLVGAAPAVGVPPVSSTHSMVASTSDLPTAESRPSISRLSSKEMVKKDAIHHLRSQLEDLRIITEDKALQASEHIKELEVEVERLRSEPSRDVKTADFIKLQSHCDVMEANHSVMQERIQELESMLTAHFLDVGVLNKIIKDQAAKLDGLEQEVTFRDQLHELQAKYENVMAENENLKSHLASSEAEFQKNIKDYSSRLAQFVTQWQERNNPSAIDDLDENGQPRRELVPGSAYHQAAIKKLQQRLDDLLQNNEELTQSREQLTGDHRDLTAKHTALNENLEARERELEARQKELQEAHNNYQEVLNSATNASKALEMSQIELDKYRQVNKKLQNELDELKYVQESNTGNDSFTNGTAGSNHYSMKINDLKAELYIFKQERDNLKDEVLQLKKKLLNMGEQ